MKTLLILASLVLAFSLRAQVNQAHLRGTTNNVQTQLNQKWPLTGGVAYTLGDVVLDGGTSTYDLTLQDFDLLSLDGRDTSLTGTQTLYLDGATTTLRGTLFLNMRTPLVHAGTAQAGGALELVDATEGISDFKANRVATVAALKALPVSAYQNGAIIATMGYHASGDGGHGVYRYDSASAATADDGLVIAPTHGTGRFLLQHNKTVNIRQFGANEVAANDTAAFTAAHTAAVAGNISTLVIPAGTFLLDGMHSITANNYTIRGESLAAKLLGNRTTSGNTILFRVYGTNVVFESATFGRTDNATGTHADPFAHMVLWRLENSVRRFTLRNSFIDGNMDGQIARAAYHYAEIDSRGLSETTGGPRQITITGNYWTDTGYRATDLQGVRDVVIANNIFHECGLNVPDYISTGGAPPGTPRLGTCVEVQSYDTGNVVHRSHNVTIANNTFYYWGDGAINTGGTIDMAIVANTCLSSEAYGINRESQLWAGVDGENAISIFGGERTTITGNVVDRVGQSAFQIRTQTTGAYVKPLKDMILANNVAIAGVGVDGSRSLESNYTIYSFEAGVTMENIAMIGNTFTTSKTTGGAVGVQCTGTAILRGLNISGNTFKGPGSGTVRGISVTTGGTFAGLVMNNNNFTDMELAFFISSGTWPTDTVCVGNNFLNISNSSLGTDLSYMTLVSTPSYLGVRPSSATGPIAQGGIIRLPNNQSIRFRNQGNTADVTALGVNNNNEVELGGSSQLRVIPSQNATVLSSAHRLARQPVAVASLAAGATLTVAGSSHHVAGNGGAVTLSATTAISAGVYDGQELFIIGTSDVNTVTVPDSGNCNLEAARVLGAGDILVLRYVIADLTDGWYEVTYRNN